MAGDTRYERRRFDRSREESLGETERPMMVSYGLVGSVAVLGVLGYVLDRLIDTGPMLLITGLLLGLGLGFYSLARLMKA